MVELNPDARLDMVLTTIVPSIVNHTDEEFQQKQLDAHENVAKQLNEICKNPVADLNQFFEDARDAIQRQDKNTKRIQVECSPNQTF